MVNEQEDAMIAMVDCRAKMARMKEREAAAVAMYFAADMTLKETGAVLGVGVEGCRRIVARGLRKAGQKERYLGYLSGRGD